MYQMQCEQLERYLDMLIQQSYSNEEKAGRYADNVASKLKSLKQQILSVREKAEKYTEQIEFWKSVGLTVEEAQKMQTQCDKSFLEVSSETYHKNIELEQQNKKLTDEVKQLQGENNELINGKYGILDLNSKLNDVKSERDNLKEKIEKLRDFHSGKGTETKFSHADILNEINTAIPEVNPQ